jgi:hypothetical protein
MPAGCGSAAPGTAQLSTFFFQIVAMYKYLLQSVEGVNWFGITALLIFFSVFCVVLFRVFFTKKSSWEAKARIPLED